MATTPLLQTLLPVKSQEMTPPPPPWPIRPSGLRFPSAAGPTLCRLGVSHGPGSTEALRAPAPVAASERPEMLAADALQSDWLPPDSDSSSPSSSRDRVEVRKEKGVLCDAGSTAAALGEGQLCASSSLSSSFGSVSLLCPLSSRHGLSCSLPCSASSHGSLCPATTPPSPSHSTSQFCLGLGIF